MHPTPNPCESLTSWLARLAGRYELSTRQLLLHNLGPASALAGAAITADLDFDPPPAVLQAVADRTGTAVADLHMMTIAGWVPWLTESLDPADGQDMFDNYVRGDSVLLYPGEAGANIVARWLPWLSAHDKTRRPADRLCPVCAADPERGIPLFGTIPLMLSCAPHGCLLELGTSVRIGLALGEPVAVRPAPDAVAALDRLHLAGPVSRRGAAARQAGAPGSRRGVAAGAAYAA